ncbi:HAE1 family hydrophobic/amphiphilic exporter-1 [Idiomarina fontislapidosi]|uniref:Acriflavine resistance protein B n=1 Tax=Idiomarina fontislapidosi TaxID=263723 RepID=A0A432XUX8_9GAMM|nr:efflux RND transporter permease subunit [Idiomarina fontislapidosi]PYE31865.1 HAE1 family hydrophobic/amphiphilic exporter-1 [Idiomarina fontislapidosi]RUO52463.1 acriflavine resistance protein B [Idiomarina fontislapidosi]
MSFIKKSHSNPFATIVCFLIVVILGLSTLNKLPVQLMPNIDRPVITILNSWRSASPKDMESEIVEPQEHMLKSIVGIEELSSTVRNGIALTKIEFAVDADMQQAFMNVINALNQVKGMPRDAEEPTTILGELESGTATMMVQKIGGDRSKDFTGVQELIKQKVEPELRKINGVADVSLQSYLTNQLQVVFDPYKLAALGITIPQLLDSVSQSKDFSGGFSQVGRREYSVRYLGQYTPEDMAQMVIAHNNGRPVYLHEVARVSKGHSEQRNFVYRNDAPAFYITLDAAKNANTVKIFEQLKTVIADLNERELKSRGLELVLSFDASTHIKRAVALVKNNLGFGIALAMLMLYGMIRGVRSTLLISVTIPVSLCAALLGLGLLDRSLNIISLAGLAFSTGLVLDAAIVVQENIVRLRQQGLALMDALVQGTREVARALFAATLTTVAIFAPVAFLGGVAGQLFYDLAITMTIAVIASMMTALFLIPVLTGLLFKDKDVHNNESQIWQRLAGIYNRLCSNFSQAWLWVLSMAVVASLTIIFLAPKTDFLPEAKWEGIIAVLQTPPGANYEVLEKELGQTLIKRLQPYRNGSKTPSIKDFNLAMSAGGRVLFIYPEKAEDSKELLNLLQTEILADLPDTRGVAFNMSLLNSMEVNGGRSVYMDFSGRLDETTRLVIERTIASLRDKLPGGYVRQVPGAQLLQAQLNITPNNYAVANAGLSRNQLGQIIRSLTDGQYVGEHFDGVLRRDVIVKADKWTSPEQLQAVPLYTPTSGVQTVDQLTEQERTVSATRLRRLGGQRVLTIGVSPPEGMSLEEVVEIMHQAKTEAEQQLGSDTFINLSGGADDLNETINAMMVNFLFAVLILFLIMAAIFRSIGDSLLVLLTTPVAVAGGVLGLWVLNLLQFQPLDLLTMIGFVILLGLVVNNAILLIERTRAGQQHGLTITAAIKQALQERVRPIYMSSLTSVVGMLPLAFTPGAGSELYRGLATVIMSGMLFSTLFMMVCMSSLLMVSEQLKAKFSRLKSLAPVSNDFN